VISARAELQPFVPPPRSITDITAILDAEKPDPKLIAELQSAADAMPPKDKARLKLAQFYYERGSARKQLGRMQEALEDGQKAVDTARGVADSNLLGRMMQFLGLQYGLVGKPKQALATYERMILDVDQPGSQGFLFNIYKQAGGILLQMGDISKADDYLRRGQLLLEEVRGSTRPGWRNGYAAKGGSWEADIDSLRAMIAEARGQFAEAEQAYERAEARKRASLKGVLESPNPPPADQIVQSADVSLTALARVKARQGRLAEAEVDARRALLSCLQYGGKYNPDTPRYITTLSNILIEEGRFADSEKLTRTAIEIDRVLGLPEDAPTTAQLLSQLGSILSLERLPKDAAEVYARLDHAIATWEPAQRMQLELNSSRIMSLFASGQIEPGLAAARALLKREIDRAGEKHFDTAVARGTLALGLARSGREAEALAEFRAAVPMLISSSRESANDEDTTIAAARNIRLQTIVEAYIGLLSRVQRGEQDAAIETFVLADSIRGHAVQAALAASSARMVAQDSTLSELVRKEQDLGKQIDAQLGTLNNVLALPFAERDEAGVRNINGTIVKLRADRESARAEINRRFPSYAELVDPRPPSVDQIKTTLRTGEAMLSFYFGEDGSFVWAVPKDGPVAFAEVKATTAELDGKVRKLREALEPQAAMISEIPAFDLALGYELYSMLLKPVEAGWKPATDLIVVTNGALGLLPLSLLPTEPATVAKGEPMFAGYKNVPWLVRTHAVTMVPSAAALRTLRALPPGKPTREALIAFGDPLFSKEQEAEAATPVRIADASATMRGTPLKRRSAPQLEGVDSAELAMLPRLPDTADELRSIAAALEADPSKVLNLGKEANEQKVKSLDLSGFKILAFATHGLVPGELNGLTQPALALSAPDVSGVAGDGLLTMEEILMLKLDADWVVLSACNTGTGAGAGAEAASGLGRAFFYAGTRALLVTNWSVHSASARELVSDLFARQAKNPRITRGEALREAMVALIDGDGYKDETGKTAFSYAHPLFWAPYTIIGDGGLN
jgi:CHAT domain-containing protein